jgi:hypothetical protein
MLILGKITKYVPILFNLLIHSLSTTPITENETNEINYQQFPLAMFCEFNFPTMKKTISILAILIIFLTTGCIELVEKIKINADQSGSMSYQLKFDKFGAIAGELTGLTDNSWKKQVEMEAEKFIDKLKTKKGIKNVRFNSGTLISDYQLSFDFEDTDYLNAAIYEMGGQKKTFFSPGYIKVTKKRFKRINFSPWINKYIKNEGIELPTSHISGALFLKTEVELPAPVRKISEKQAILTPDRKVTVKYDLNKVLENQVKTGLKIKY